MSFKKLWKKITHRHEWVRTNDADEMDVPDSYPPSTVCYISPRRKCSGCGRCEWYVGPEVCGGHTARWVGMPKILDTENKNHEISK